MELSSPKIKIFHEVTSKLEKIKKKHSEKFLIFQEMELSGPTFKKLIFSKQKICYSGGNLQSPKNKNFLYFGKQNFLAPILKKSLYS